MGENRAGNIKIYPYVRFVLVSPRRQNAHNILRLQYCDYSI